MGRVQSATLHLICQREREIQNFVPQDYWSVFVEYAEGFRAFFRGESKPISEEPLDDATVSERKLPESTRVLTLAEADRLVAIAHQHPHQIVQIEGKVVSKSPPPPFITSSLQQAAGSRCGLNPERTMQVAQSLYEKGLITYMRTDSTALSPEFQTQARRWLEERDPGNVPKRPPQYGSKKGAQEAHEAIRPTDVFLPSVQLKQELSKEEFDLYVLIWKRAIASQCKPAQIQQTKVTAQSGPVKWQAEGRVLQEAGYSKYWKNLQEDAELPTLTQGQALTLHRAAHEKKQTTPPPRYSEPKLVQAMERLGIGRPSTYAPTIKILKTRTYVEVQKGSLHPTALGMGVDQFLQEALPDLLEPKFTAQMEETLDHIAQGDVEWQQWLTTWNQTYFVPALATAQKVIPRYRSAVPVASFPTEKKPRLSSRKPKTAASKPEGRS
ncbi:type IA DNA topoisomerase, partial [Leptolyngbya sp. AN02str]|uniref:type IA DNA topoisomerase n=1 Tax=Leptolyngbya sp. AN02str TaxID=3423363 RepID=UPI003D31E34A